ncbi:MAG: hypothetical protein K6A14_04135 [Erysipelotrichaceae bacterium]|nr:hypothetical protein [Erysipelotrichaceae bacterium]
MKVVSSSQMRLIESRDISEGRYSPQDYAVLVAQAMQNIILQDQARDILILCGDNANGSYGFMLAYLLLKNSHISPKIIYHGSTDNTYYQLAQQNGLQIVDNPRFMKEIIDQSAYIVDCLFGSELDEMISYPDNFIISWVNEAENYVLSCDLPSGLDGNDGSLYGCCIKADKTMTIELPKLGLFLKPGCEYAGEIICQPVGLSYDAIGSVSSNVATLEEKQLREQVEKMDSHTSVLLVAGSQQATSGYLLTCQSLLAAGCDQVALAGDQRSYEAAGNHLYEVERILLDDENLSSSLKQIDYNRYDLVTYWGGFSRGQLIVEKLMESGRPLLFTPAGAEDLKAQSQLLERRAATALILDQAGYEEFFGTVSPASFLDDAVGTCRKYGDLKILYRSAYSLAIDSQGITIGHDSDLLGHKAGLMDVLTGCCGAFLAQNNDRAALSSANEVCFRAAQNYRRDHYKYALSASQLTEELTRQLYELSK